ncbi:hypothetical protein [Candidatus Poriferisodalis sp.]|uniref:hypothetical protein n=1 Tax=Candidatus Poriferisodalis sp. TaxID=3101277 RepID=UPI003B01A1A5
MVILPSTGNQTHNSWTQTRDPCQPYGSDSYELADGSSQTAEFTGARLEFMDSDAFVRVVYGPPGCEPLLGVLALEPTRFEVDPVSQEIRRTKRPRL